MESTATTGGGHAAMWEAIPRPRALLAGLRDALELAKPRISAMVVLTAGIGMWAAPGSVGLARSILLLSGTALLVASANVLNSWIERDADAKMIRTRTRPLPSRRIDPWTALALGILSGVFAIPLLAVAISPLVALLGAIAHALYVLVYTPLKRVSPWALEIGALPGAIPPLMGWAAATGSLSPGGWALFGILFFWQLPHFLAIALYLEEDYRRGGFRVLSVVRDQGTARRRLLSYSIALAFASLAPWLLGLTGPAYACAAAVLGLLALLIAARGVVKRLGAAWARRVMLWTLVHQVALVVALLIDAR